MSYTIRYAAVTGVSLALLLAAQSVAAGPPWISVELPANPHHASTRDATFLVRTYHHSAVLEGAVTARAEGLVGGERRSMKLEITRSNIPGVYAVRGAPAQGSWVVVVTLKESESSTATALVRLGERGEVVAVHVPSETTRDGWVVPRAVTATDIENELRAALRTAELQPGPAAGSPLGAGPLGALPLALLIVGGVAGAALRRRVR